MTDEFNTWLWVRNQTVLLGFRLTVRRYIWQQEDALARVRRQALAAARRRST